MISLRDFTVARVGLRRAGNALATGEHLDFQLAHAMARDAVHAPFDADGLLADVHSRGWNGVIVESAAQDRAEYLKRPDLGRRLRAPLRAAAHPVDLVIVLADGLSALAVERHAVPLLEAMEINGDVPILIARLARVALGDEIGEQLRAAMSLVLIGERPGLSSPDSLGAYLTWAPRAGRTDADRYCVSNIRGAGLSYQQGAARLRFLMSHARDMCMTGTGLGSLQLPGPA
jgi:ethanolamine ammonia-lyase small subunit